IEINYTFNHLPTEKNIAEWTAATGDDFVFGLKASQQITHRAQLRDPARTLPTFFERARLLGPRLGPILFQTPPWVRRDDDRLAMCLAALPRDMRSALEVRDPSWYVPEVYELLGTASARAVARRGAIVRDSGRRLAAIAPYFFWAPYVVAVARVGPEADVPTALRWIGIGLTVSGVAFSLWAIATLGRHYDLVLEIHA